MEENSILHDLQDIFSKLPQKVQVHSRRAAQLAQIFYDEVNRAGVYADSELFDTYGDKVNKYIVYYDIGKNKLSDTYLSEGQLKLPEELQLYQSHVKYGIMVFDELFSQKEYLTEEEAVCYNILTEALADHHENYDGSGFPDRKAGRDIYPFGRIMAICDDIIEGFMDGVPWDVIEAELHTKNSSKYDPSLIELSKSAIHQYRDKISPPDQEETTREFRAVEMLYQPLFNTDADRIYGYEALIRINDPKLGVISPAAFIPVAEKSHRIFELTKIALESVCKTLARFYGKQELPLDYIAINISGKCLSRASFLSTVKRVMARYQINPRNLVFELTESSIVLQNEIYAQNFREIRKLGIRLAIDDFGTEYSSMSRLKDLEFDILKIDQTFTKDICNSRKSAELVRTLIDMAHNLNMQVIAEGVETVDQKNMLVQMGCHLIQGYYYGKPKRLEE